jgi:hypothetical protein
MSCFHLEKEGNEVKPTAQLLVLIVGFLVSTRPSKVYKLVSEDNIEE